MERLRFSLARTDQIQSESIRGTAPVTWFADKAREARLRRLGKVHRRDNPEDGRTSEEVQTKQTKEEIYGHEWLLTCLC